MPPIGKWERLDEESEWARWRHKETGDTVSIGTHPEYDDNYEHNDYGMYQIYYNGQPVQNIDRYENAKRYARNVLRFHKARDGDVTQLEIIEQNLSQRQTEGFQ